MEDARVQAETEAESWKGKLAKSRDAERVVIDQATNQKVEIFRLIEQAGMAKARIGELDGALKENQVALEAARADIEGLRGEAAVSRPEAGVEHYSHQI